MSRVIDKHDVHAFCERAREAIGTLESAASAAAHTGWVAEAEDHELLAKHAYSRATGALGELLECLAYTLAEQAERESSAAESLLP